MHECPGEAEGDDIGDEVHDKPAVAGEKNEHGDDEGHGKQGEEQGGEVDPDELGVHLEEGCVGVVADGVGPAAKAKPEVGDGVAASSRPERVTRERAGLAGMGWLAVSIILSLVAPEVESLHVGLGVFAGVVADVPRGSFPDAGGAIPRAGDDAFAVSAEHG